MEFGNVHFKRFVFINNSTNAHLLEDRALQLVKMLVDALAHRLALCVWQHTQELDDIRVFWQLVKIKRKVFSQDLFGGFRIVLDAVQSLDDNHRFSQFTFKYGFFVFAGLL